jgi:hypothetical protein
MTIFWILLGAAALVWLAVAVVGTVRRDGYGSRRPPLSHEPWDLPGTFGPRFL